MKAWKKIVATIMVSTICLSGCGGGAQEKKR